MAPITRIRQAMQHAAVVGMLVPCLAIAQPNTIAAREAPPAKEDSIFTTAEVELPFAHGKTGAVTIEVAIDQKAEVGMERTPYWVLFAAGAASVPMAVLNPFYGFGVLIPIIGPPINAVFNARRETLVAAVKGEPLPERVLASLLERLASEHIATETSVRLRITSYGLVPSSGRPAAALMPGDELCLAAHAALSVSRERALPAEAKIVVGMKGQEPEAPPPVCASIAQFAKDDGLYLRQAIRELAEVLAALAVLRMKEAP